MRRGKGSLAQVQEARFAVERRALKEAADDPTLGGVARRLYREAREMAVRSKADPYYVGRADALEDLVARMESAREKEDG